MTTQPFAPDAATTTTLHAAATVLCACKQQALGTGTTSTSCGRISSNNYPLHHAQHEVRKGNGARVFSYDEDQFETGRYLQRPRSSIIGETYDVCFAGWTVSNLANGGLRYRARQTGSQIDTIAASMVARVYYMCPTVSVLL